MAARGRLANENSPKLLTFDARGARRDEIEFHPAYHELIAESTQAGIHSSTWTAEGKAAAAPWEVVRGAKLMMAAQIDTGHLCPILMTRASVAALSAQPELLARVMPLVASRAYDPSFTPWWTTRSMTLRMGMTEKQGGTDVRPTSRGKWTPALFNLDVRYWLLKNSAESQPQAKLRQN
jgi:putative acyl-CoA dehydrogenase